MPSKDDERRQRLAEELRANLRKRKDQARGRAEGVEPPPVDEGRPAATPPTSSRQ